MVGPEYIGLPASVLKNRRANKQGCFRRSVGKLVREEIMMRKDISSFGRPGHLPFDDREEEFIEAVKENDFVILYGDTGSGKTLRGPVALHKAFPKMCIAVTQPRRNAVSSLAKRIAFEQGWKVGDEHIGYYLARQKSLLTKKTKIAFQVDQSLVNRILEDNLLSEYDAVFLDEQHLRTVSIDILQGRLSSIRRKRSNFKVIIATATPNIAKLEDFYRQFGSVSTVRVEGRPGKVDIRWAWMRKKEHHLDAVKRWMEVLVEEGCRGKVAVFLPGVEEINEVIDFVESLQRPDIDALPCHGKLDDEEQNRIYEPVNGNRLRFIAATEIIETSITIPDLVGGIDSMQVFRRDINWMGVASYVKRNIAKDSAKQRMGRFGRIKGTTGFYMPIIGFESDESAERHWNRLAEHTQPQILATDLESAVLTVEAMGIEFDQFPWMDRPLMDDYEKTVTNLQRLGALDGNGRITEEGKIYTRMPFSAGLAKAYFKAEEFGVAEAVKIGIAGLQGNDSIFWVPGRRKDVELTPAMEELLPEEAREFVENRTRTTRTKNGKKEIKVRYLPAFSSWNGQRLAKYHRERFAAGTHSDIVAIIVAYLQWQENGRSSEWARARMLKPKVLWNMFNGIKDIDQALREAGMNGKKRSDNVETADPQLVVRALAAGLVNNLAVHKERNNYSGILYDLIVSSSSALNSTEEWPKVVLFSQVTLAKGIGRRGSDLRFAEILSEIDPEDIATDNPQLCKYSYTNYEYNPEKDIVEASEHLKYVNTEIRVRKVARGSDDLQAIKAFADTLALGKVEYPGKADNNALRSEIDALNLRWQGSIGQINSGKLSEIFQARLTEVRACTLKEAKDRGVDFGISEADAELILGIESLANIRKRTAVERPEIWTINGQEFPLEYKLDPWSFTGVILKLPVQVARTIKSADLPDFGDNCNVRVHLFDEGYSDIYVDPKEIGKLTEKIESRRIEQCWSEARGQHETSWTSDFQKVIGWLDKVGSRVEVTRTDNGSGEPVYGFVGLKRYSGYSEWQLFLAETKEKAEEENRKSLEFLLKATIKEYLVIPKEEPWQKSGYWNWELTDMGSALQARFEMIVREYAEDLTSSNIEEKIEALKTACEQAKLEIGGQHESAKKIIEDAKSGLEEEITSLNDKDFVNSEIEEARKFVREAEESLANGAYTDAKVKSEKVNEILEKIDDRTAHLQAKIDNGEILVGFEVWHRRGGMNRNGDGWVICPDGSLREHDSDDVRRYKSDGNYRWNYVNKNELALKWSCETMRDVAGSSEFIVAKMPVGGLTNAQCEAVRRIELEDIGTTENSFGLDPEAAERQAKLVAEVAEAFPVCPVCKEPLGFDEDSYRGLTGEFGIHICQDDRRISRLVNWNKPFDRETESRDAQVVISKRVSDGVIEALAYEKWGGWNVNLRWREMTEEELAEEDKIDEVVNFLSPSADSLVALVAKFGK